ncbi:hypothetical protein BOO71_0007426 [Deinococcus marmoris]|uniref:Uncharacterized protein n=1 Tax=Deinococcus marmoris TaxID=249408 RepID=A0A1U7NYY2_9DEIO|nr:hypothetical protein BOO71_0007426 [Deinococcus marmoris]
MYGLSCLAGMLLILSAKPHLSFTARMLRCAAGLGLPFSSFALSGDGLRGEFITGNLTSALLLRIPVLLVMALVFGAVAASIQQRRAA